MDKKKYFIITIDTEGDNLWKWKKEDPITTENAKFLQRFQNLCDRYGFKPVWLSNYEMLNDSFYVNFISKVVNNNCGEIGMHLHAWYSKPDFELSDHYDGAPYLIEYPVEIMEAKIEYMTHLIESRVGIKPVSHRAGRWAINETYIRILIKNGYKVDCSITPGIDWSKCPGGLAGMKGCNYVDFPHNEFWIPIGNENSRLLEIPVTVYKSHKLYLPERKKIKDTLAATYRMIVGTNIWLRPENNNKKQMIELISRIENSDANYIMFMIHSSELMPGGSPTFKTSEEIENLYRNLNYLFEKLSHSFSGITLQEYYDVNQNDISAVKSLQ